MRKLIIAFLSFYYWFSCNFPGLASTKSSSVELIVNDGGQPCNNLLYPLVAGNQWIYQITSSGSSSKIGISVSAVEGSQASLDELDINSGVITKTTAECSGTAIVNFPLMTIKMIVGNYLNGELDLEHSSGVFAPDNATLTASDATWEGNYIAHGKVSAQDTEGNVTVTVEESPVELSFQTAGWEVVSVPAGTFENALKVQRSMTVDVAITSQGLTVNGTIEVKSTQWFELGVGLLKTTVDESNLVFIGGTYPIGLVGTGELMEFHPGQ